MRQLVLLYEAMMQMSIFCYQAESCGPKIHSLPPSTAASQHN